MVGGQTAAQYLLDRSASGGGWSTEDMEAEAWVGSHGVASAGFAHLGMDRRIILDGL